MRAQGGHNAGHTIKANGVMYDFHILPSGLVNPNCINLIGSGCVVYMPQFFHELETLEKGGISTKDRIYLSDRAHVILDLHLRIDGLEEVELGAKAVGTTKKGIGPTYSTKMSRSGIRICDLYSPDTLEAKVKHLAAGFQKRFGDLLGDYSVENELKSLAELSQRLAPFVIDQIPLIRDAKAKQAPMLVEGANAIMLDIDHGTYPYCTSSNTGVGGILTGLTLGWRSLRQVIGVVKAYTTRVGAGPFPTELHDDDGDKLQSIGKEFGVTTGRRRRCGWLDLVVVKYSHDVNDYTSLNLTKLDVLDTFDEIKVCTGYQVDGQSLESFPAGVAALEKIECKYETLPGWKTATTGAKTWADLPENARKYIEFIEKFVDVKVSHIGTGPGRESMIVR